MYRRKPTVSPLSPGENPFADASVREPVGGFVGANLALFAALLGFDAADRALFDFVAAVRSSPARAGGVRARRGVARVCAPRRRRSAARLKGP